tara:strand:- start:3753 stop:4298 length:546 start_codon:yes stop_codon:yes gene_type:complete
MIPKLDPSDASEIIKNGGVVIYPTEGIYGIGCDPFNRSSIEDIFKIKGRESDKSFIILCSKINHIERVINIKLFDKRKLNDNSFTTWIVPSSEDCPTWLEKDKSVAIRITNHPVIDELCHYLNGPIVSTSANYSNQKYINDITIIEKHFDGKVDCIVNGSLGKEKKPSMIRNILTNKILRH